MTTQSNVDARTKLHGLGDPQPDEDGFAMVGAVPLIRAASTPATFDYNLLFANASGNCNGCTPGGSSEYGDRAYTAPGSNDYSLSSASPAIDAALDLGLDRNGSGACSFNGDLPISVTSSPTDHFRADA